MKFFKNGNCENFFEYKRFNETDLPTLGDVSDLIKDICNKKVVRNAERKLTVAEWNLIKKFVFFDDSKINEIPSCRNSAYKNIPAFLEYVKNNEILGFENFMYNNNETLLDATKKINVETYSSLYEYFAKGEHIGRCGEASKLIGIMFEKPKFVVKGNSSLLKGTENSADGQHSWIETTINGKEYIVDTSLMVVIPKEFGSELGYQKIKEADLKEILEYYDKEEICYNHYNISSKYTTENKASYNTYLENLKQIKKEKEKSRDE